uniref:Uncharacterized protein n=1 Tax=Corvus moneduloides TaxID=1196302 RepID=A0A8C3GXX4_CORMO
MFLSRLTQRLFVQHPALPKLGLWEALISRPRAAHFCPHSLRLLYFWVLGGARGKQVDFSSFLPSPFLRQLPNLRAGSPWAINPLKEPLSFPCQPRALETGERNRECRGWTQIFSLLHSLSANQDLKGALG